MTAFKTLIAQHADADETGDEIFHEVFYGPFLLETELSPANTSGIFQPVNDVQNELTGIDYSGEPVMNQADRYGSLADYYPLGDLNNDGFDDFALVKDVADVDPITEPGPTTYDKLGRVFIMYGHGNRDQPAAQQVIIDFPIGLSNYGTNGMRFGEGGVVAGDFNGDGTKDIAVSVHNINVGSEPEAGGVAIYFGPDFYFEEGAFRSPQIYPTNNPIAGEKCGYSLAAADTNQDGRDNIVLGCAGVGHENIVIYED